MEPVSFAGSGRSWLKSIALGFVLASMAAMAASFSAHAETKKRQLITMSYGSNTDKVLAPSTYDELAKLGYEIVFVPMAGEAGFARLQAERSHPTIDLYHFSGHHLEAKKLGLLEDLGDLGGANIPDQFRDPDNQWVAFALSPIGILYDKSKIKTPPTSWTDLMKPEYKGHVAVPTLANFIGAPFLVKLAEALGGSMENMVPAFKALAKMSDDGLQLFDRPVALQTYFGGGDVWMVPYDASNAYRLAELGLPVGFVIPEEGTTATVFTKVIAKSAPNVEAARTAVAKFLTPEAQVAMARDLRWSPVNADVELPADLKNEVLSGQRLQQLVTPIDQVQLRKHLPDWIDRFNREIAVR